MLMGEFQHNIDKKGRVFIPAKFREELGGEIVVSKSLDSSPCLFVFTKQEWDSIVEKINKGRTVEQLKMQRYLCSSASEPEYDTQGRILVPQSLRAFAELLDGPIKIVGAGSRAEIWNINKWEEYTGGVTQDDLAIVLEKSSDE